MKNLFNNQNNKIQILVIVIVLLLVFLVLCKSRISKETFTAPTPILQHSDISNIDLNVNNNRNYYFKSVRGFKVNKVFEDGIEYEFYEPENTYTHSVNNITQYRVDTTNPSTTTKSTIIKNFLLIVGIYKKNDDDSNPIFQNYKIISIQTEDLEVISQSDDFVLYTNNTGVNTRPARRFKKKINLPKVDSTDNKTLYYKLGLVTVYNYINSSTATQPIYYIETSNVMNVSNMYIQNNNYMIFLRNSDMENVDTDWNDFQKMKTEQRAGKVVDPDSGKIISTADGEFQYMKSNLGGYPDNLYLQLDTNYNTLNELATNQLSQGILNVNVHTENL